uniref:Uncharacterized protein n=1 Tax=Plectus sambesii TaxID=2011161 RepID=A0A914VGN5_9BILA
MSEVHGRRGVLHAAADTQRGRTDDRFLPVRQHKLWSSLEGVKHGRLLFLVAFLVVIFFAAQSWFSFLLQLALCVLLWSLTLYGLWLCGIYIIHRCFPSARLGLVQFFALLGTIPIVFEMIRLYQEEMAVKTTMIVQGAPASCGSSAFSYLSYYLSRKNACLDYYRAVDRSVLWAVNPLKVLSSLVLETAVLVSGLLGKGIGLYFTSLMSELPWI